MSNCKHSVRIKVAIALELGIRLKKIYTSDPYYERLGISPFTKAQFFANQK